MFPEQIILGTQTSFLIYFGMENMAHGENMLPITVVKIDLNMYWSPSYLITRPSSNREHDNLSKHQYI